MGQMVASEASARLDVPFGIVDLSLAPTPAVGDSVARILEEMGLSVCGTHGTTAALALLNDAVKKGGVMASGHVGGLSGAFIPVSEDEGMIAAALDGTLTIDKLEAVTCVCSVGLDMIAVPGSTTAETISAIIADEAAVGMVNSKTTAVRIIPVEGADVGDTVEMGGLLGSAPLMPVHEASSADFIARGGRIPAPLQSLKTDMIRPATSFDIPRALAIYHSARQFMRRSGNTVQWVNGYPSEALLRSDVAAGRLFVMEDAGGVYAVFAFIIGDDPTYQVIDGAWLDDATPYGTLHRLGSDGTHTGVLAEAVAWAWTRCPHLRADTHEDNHPMRRCLERAGFAYTGTIHVADGTPRRAYERI